MRKRRTDKKKKNGKEKETKTASGTRLVETQFCHPVGKRWESERPATSERAVGTKREVFLFLSVFLFLHVCSAVHC